MYSVALDINSLKYAFPFDNCAIHQFADRRSSISAIWSVASFSERKQFTPTRGRSPLCFFSSYSKLSSWMRDRWYVLSIAPKTPPRRSMRRHLSFAHALSGEFNQSRQCRTPQNLSKRSTCETIQLTNYYSGKHTFQMKTKS